MNNKKEVFITKSFEETQRLGESFARLHPCQGATLTVCLYGDLGSGKTTFVQGLAKGLGIKRRIISPTFVLVRRYELQTQNSKLKTQNYNSKLKSLERFYHIDLYRTENERDIEGLGLRDIMEDSANIVVIEWAEKLGDLLPKQKTDIFFEYIDESKRKIVIKNPKHKIINPK